MSAQEFAAIHLCVSQLHRLPQECPHLTMRDLVKLQAYLSIMKDTSPNG